MYFCVPKTLVIHDIFERNPKSDCFKNKHFLEIIKNIGNPCISVFQKHWEFMYFWNAIPKIPLYESNGNELHMDEIK